MPLANQNFTVLLEWIPRDLSWHPERQCRKYEARQCCHFLRGPETLVEGEAKA